MTHPSLSLLGGALLALLGTVQAQAAPAADLSQLGNRLTPIGAEKAGNADGSIPA